MNNKIGTFRATYNKNSKVLYTKFTSDITISDAINCDKAECTEDLINEQVKKLVAKFFLKVNSIEDSDLASNPLELKQEHVTYYSGNTQDTQKVLKSMDIGVFIKNT